MELFSVLLPCAIQYINGVEIGRLFITFISSITHTHTYTQPRTTKTINIIDPRHSQIFPHCFNLSLLLFQKNRLNCTANLFNVHMQTIDSSFDHLTSLPPFFVELQPNTLKLYVRINEHNKEQSETKTTRTTIIQQ